MKLQALQRRLERIYEVELAHDVDDFLTTERSVGERVHPRTAKEKLILVQSGDDLDIALYIDASIVSQLGDSDPLDNLDQDNISAFLTALEGVSHFLYLAWNAGYDRPVSLLELELQAEVDKYVTSAMLLSEQGGRFRPNDLRRRLFHRPRFHDELAHHERIRYSHANNFADAYCRQLERSYRGNFCGAGMINDLRRFYRLPQTGKLRRIAA